MNNWRDALRYNNGIPEIYLIWENNNFLSQIINEFKNIIANLNFDKILTIESKGIIFAAPISYYFEKPLVIVQKKLRISNYKNILDQKIINRKNEEETLYIDLKNMRKNENYIIIDEVVQTRSSIKACLNLLNATNNRAKDILCVANLSDGDDINGIKIHSLI
ncbi:MAG: hypothetical protein KA885_07875 [Spirochaetes bacterium]|nr:hypothetical protein [Spirochaetota bacterium]